MGPSILCWYVVALHSGKYFRGSSLYVLWVVCSRLTAMSVESLGEDAHLLEDEHDDCGSWPPTHELASVWEENSTVRRSLRQNKKILVWPNPKMTGVATVESLSTNRSAVQDALQLWASHSPVAKSPPVDWLREEVGFGRVMGSLKFSD